MINSELTTPLRHYNKTAISLHWLVAFLIIATFSLGWIMTSMEGFTPQRIQLYTWHKWSGITIFALVIIRLAWRLGHPPPALPLVITPLERILALANHYLLYILMLLIPITGYGMSSASGKPIFYLNLIHIPLVIPINETLASTFKAIHYYANYFLAFIVAVHILAVIKHECIDRIPLLFRTLRLAKLSGKKRSIIKNRITK